MEEPCEWKRDDEASKAKQRRRKISLLVPFQCEPLETIARLGSTVLVRTPVDFRSIVSQRRFGSALNGPSELVVRRCPRDLSSAYHCGSSQWRHDRHA